MIDFAQARGACADTVFDVWWTPECGAVHLARHRGCVFVTASCPDGLKPGWDE